MPDILPPESYPAGTKVLVRAIVDVRVTTPGLTMDKAEAAIVAAGSEVLARDDAAKTFRIKEPERPAILTVDMSAGQVLTSQGFLRRHPPMEI